MTADDRRNAGCRGGEDDQVFVEPFIVPHVLPKDGGEVGELGSDGGSRDAERLRQHVCQVGGQLRHFAPEVPRNEPPSAMPGRHQQKNSCAE